MDYVENRMAQGKILSRPYHKPVPNRSAEAAKPTPSPEVYVPCSYPTSDLSANICHHRQTIATPINLILISLLILIMYYQFKPKPAAKYETSALYFSLPFLAHRQLTS